MVTPLCGQSLCRAYHLTVREFERLGGVRWKQSFRIRLGRLANKLYSEIYGKPAKKVRSRTAWRNKVGKYPCGILEQAYRELRGQAAVATPPVGTQSTREDQQHRSNRTC
jgi:hypothetical protein